MICLFVFLCLYRFADDESDVEADKPSTNKKTKKQKKTKKPVGDKKVVVPSDWPEVEANDIVEDLHMSDLED